MLTSFTSKNTANEQRRVWQTRPSGAILARFTEWVRQKFGEDRRRIRSRL